LLQASNGKLESASFTFRGRKDVCQKVVLVRPPGCRPNAIDIMLDHGYAHEDVNDIMGAQLVEGL